MRKKFKRLGIAAMAGLCSATLSPLWGAELTREIPLQIAKNQRVFATVQIPSKLKKGQKIPAFLIFGGFESAANVLSLIHPDRPVALASFDYPFSGSRKLHLKDSVEILRQAKRLEPETVLGIEELAAALKQMPEIDGNRIIVIGASFGSPFAVAAAARDPDIAGVAIIDGFGRIPETADHVILRSWIPKYGWIARPFSWLISRIGWLYLGVESPEADARSLRPNQRVLMITAENDSFIPRTSSDSLWNAIEKSPADKLRILMPGDHLMPGGDQLIHRMIQEVDQWMKAKWPDSRV